MPREPTQDEIGELYRLLGKRLYGTALRLLGGREEAEDAVHDAFIAYFEARRGVEIERSGAWLHRVVVNRCLDRLRARSRWRTEEVVDEQLGGGPASPAGLRLDLARAVAALPEAARQIFLLHDVEGFQHREIATLLGVAEGTSKSQLFRARELLRAALSPGLEAAS